MKTYTDAERYQALRDLAVTASHDPDLAEEISSRIWPDPTETITDSDFDNACDALCELMQTEN